MKSRDFCFWLQGYIELSGAIGTPPNSTQWDMIRRHLAMVFKHEIDPTMGDKPMQEALDNIHTVSNPTILMKC